ncbi:MAG: helix-turn-helix transcriptional regulator, partial [Rickettsia sp.]|nr:helix-turn-helix transcriptional regulator [Rickettsia sp.]
MVRKNAFIQEIDKIIGKKIYSLRLSQGFSRQQLSDIIQVTHQQLQKYEKGT